MNKKASVVIYTLMLGMVIIILALALAPSIQDSTTAAMNESSGDTQGLDCTNASISSFDKAACIATDLTLFYFVGVLVFIGGLIITAKVVSG
jgi:Trk-type K+ transport system membrane component